MQLFIKIKTTSRSHWLVDNWNSHEKSRKIIRQTILQYTYCRFSIFDTAQTDRHSLYSLYLTCRKFRNIPVIIVHWNTTVNSVSTFSTEEYPFLQHSNSFITESIFKKPLATVCLTLYKFILFVSSGYFYPIRVEIVVKYTE